MARGTNGKGRIPRNASFYPDPDDPEECITRERAQEVLVETNAEYKWLATDPSPAALNRKTELARDLRKLSDFMAATERKVNVEVPRSVTGEPFVIGDTIFWPGTHVVASTVAQTLLHMIDSNRRVELDRMKQNGREVDLGNIGGRASNVDA